jgi:cytochrome c biogenesis protein CcdA
MNKKIFVVGVAIIMFCLAVTVVFAAEAGVSYTSDSVTVWNTGKGTIPTVELCVIYKDAAKQQRETSMSFSNVSSTRQKKPFNLGTVIGAYSTYCAVPIE